ncbi:MAG: RecX family transcriptional regulator [Taibaiella sp.]|nr:RecX family transcriptional regulator [Taibaiella sp.]
MDTTQSIQHYCRYQERCHKEVRNKLYELGCTTPEVEGHIADLIAENIVNEERYARSYARGRFRMKQWGRVKIISQLRFNKVSDYCIKKALTEIDGDEYYKTLLKLTEKKWVELKKERSPKMRAHKVRKYLLQKGYENSLITDALEENTNPA